MAECIKCLMDTEFGGSIRIDRNGLCNQCIDFVKNVRNRTKSGSEGEQAIRKIVINNRQRHPNKEYDCILGISGGVDSCFLAHTALELGFKPLLIHVDNGWNTPTSVGNIEKIVDGLNLDLVTYVLDFEEFSSLQRAFLKASVPDGEIPTDFAIQVLLWKAAREHKVKTILTGMNYLTESGHIPEWSYGHSDWKYINAINEAFGDRPLKSYPKMTLPDLFKFTYLRKIKRVSILNYLDYDRAAAEKVLVENYDWEKYGGKHNESTYTKFYQEILLPSKFGIDKRNLHLSDLIRANQMTKVQAKEILSKDFSNSASKERILIKYILKRLMLSEREFEVIMKSKKRLYSDFPNNSRYVSVIRGIIQILRKFKMYPH